MKDSEKVEAYERLLHEIQMCAEVTLDHTRIGALIGRVCSWSHAHRHSEGYLTDEERLTLIDDHTSHLAD